MQWKFMPLFIAAYNIKLTSPQLHQNMKKLK